MCIPKSVGGMGMLGGFNPSSDDSAAGGVATVLTPDFVACGVTTAHTTTAQEVRTSDATARWPGKNLNWYEGSPYPVDLL
jgi:hypothetical protein